MARKVIIESEKNERHAVIYDERKDPQTGRLHIKQKTFSSNEEADAFLEELGSIKEDVRIQITMDQKDKDFTQVPFTQYAIEWFYGEYSREKAATTLKTSQYYLEKHIVPYFVDKHLQQITVKDIEELFDQKRQEEYTGRVILGIRALLNNLYQSAIQKGHLKKNPTKGLKKMFNDVGRTFVPWSNEEINQFLKAAYVVGEGMMYEFEIGTGLRLVELLAISWSDVDFDKGTVNVKRNVSLGGNGIVEIRRGGRTIVIPENLIPKLKKYKEEQQLMKERLGYQYQDHDLVFPKKDGGVQNPLVVQRKFARLIEKADVRKITFHGLRKTHASLLYDAGVSPDYIKNQLGHKRIETTINRFSHNS